MAAVTQGSATCASALAAGGAPSSRRACVPRAAALGPQPLRPVLLSARGAAAGRAGALSLRCAARAARPGAPRPRPPAARTAQAG
jgi:hypothetical protein